MFSLGSVSDLVYNLIEDVPAGISGTRLIDICYMQQKFIENLCGITIGSVNINEKYWSPMVKLTEAELLGYMELVGADVSSIRLGDLSVSKGGASNTSTTRIALREAAIQELKEGIGTRISFKKAFG